MRQTPQAVKRELAAAREKNSTRLPSKKAVRTEFFIMLTIAVALAAVVVYLSVTNGIK